MLSNQTHDYLLGRHQRQNSTPTVFDTQKTLHRRGLSLGQPGRTLQNDGLPELQDRWPSAEPTLGQRLTQTASMREAQQQPMARPGHNQEIQYETMQVPQERALRAEQQEQRQERATEIFSNNYSTTIKMQYEDSPRDIPRQERGTGAFSNNNYITSMTGLDDEAQNMLNSFYQSPVLKQQPRTPPSQTRTDYFPLTPSATPYSASIRKGTHIRTADSSPTRRDPNLTIKASNEMQRGASCQDNFAAMRQLAMSSGIPSPPNTAPLQQRGSLDLAAFPPPNLFNMSSLKMDIPLYNDGFDASNYSPVSNAASSAVSSFQSSPEIAHMSLFDDIDGGTVDTLMISNAPDLSVSRSAMDLEPCFSPQKEVSHSRSQSVSESECAQENGVTSEEIASFISNPDGENRWTCLYPDCGKKFARKENVRAHVQTHLDDRQFRCKDCTKRFVRQHDLKRHANIHSGIRSYPCDCGRKFARHDALTRHKQRGMCIGAFEGTPKKVAKRGRPKKTRPDTEDRLEKSAATRQRALEKLLMRSPTKYASSISGSSVSSYPSPEQMFQDIDMNALSPILGYTPAGSPGHSTGDCPSDTESRKTSSSHFGTPPELDISSSSPAASRFFDFEGSSEANLSEPLSIPVDATNTDFFGQDFNLSAAPIKDEPSKDLGNSIFNDYFNSELQGTDFAPLPTDAFENTFNPDNPWTADF